MHGSHSTRSSLSANYLSLLNFQIGTRLSRKPTDQGVRLLEPLLQPHDCYQALGETYERREAHYRALFKGYIDETDLEKIREAVNKGWILGNDRFRGQIEEALQRSIKPYPHGGDRRSDKFQKFRR